MNEQQPDAEKTARSSAEKEADSPSEARPPLRIPPLLLEKDDPSPAPDTCAEPKYALGPVPRQDRFEAEPGELPPAYGTGKLLWIPRDPHWFYAHWDLSKEQQQAYNALSIDRHLVVRVHQEPGGSPVNEVDVHPESQSWFVEVPEAGAEYKAELGYYQRPSEWVTVATSLPAMAPAEKASRNKTAQFAMAGTQIPDRPKELPQQPMTPPTGVIIPPRVEWIPALDKVDSPANAGEIEAERAMGRETAGDWTPAQEKAMAELVRRGRAGSSFEIAEWMRWEIEREISSQQFGRPPAQEGESSPAGGEQLRLKGFWFNVNAELIIYGATDPAAIVTVGGQPIEVRADGTFTCRLSLPDGEHVVDVAAHSQTDSRRAKLSVCRATEYQETGG